MGGKGELGKILSISLPYLGESQGGGVAFPPLDFPTDKGQKSLHLICLSLLLAVNELMDISRELEETRARRAAAAEHVTRLKQQLVFLQRPSYSTQLMAQAFAGQTTESYRKLVAQAKVPVRNFCLCGSLQKVMSPFSAAKG